ncbi:MAG: TerB family tellurite resistance protein [Bacteroidales bacterium]|nr:TerB family tellurite resistance protein [Bacteroidales bacterium]
MIKKITLQNHVLEGACPVCGDDMILHKYVHYFSLFGKALFPLKIIEEFYKCEVCKSSYNTDIKDLIKLDDEKKQLRFEEAGKLYAKALIAAMTYMAVIDGHLDEKEQQSLHAIIGKYSNIADELIEIMDSVKNQSNKDDFVYKLIKKVHQELSIDSVLALLSEAVKMLMADGKIDKNELKLLDKFILEANLPKEFYYLLISKVKKI